MHLRLVGLTLVVIGSSAACFVSFDDYPLEDDAAGGAASGGSGTGGSGATSGGGEGGMLVLDECGEASVCAPAAPLGWTGPAALSELMTAVDCEGWGELEHVGESNVVVPAATCECSCGDPTGQSCNGDTTFEYHEESDCSGVHGTLMIAPNQCIGAVSPPNNTASGMLAIPPTPSGGSCVATDIFDVPPLTSDRSFLCFNESSQGGCSDAEVCVERPGGNLQGRLCVFTEGDQECPEATVFSERTVVYVGDTTQTRECSPCTCGAPSGGQCQGVTIEYHGSAGCGALIGAQPADGTCYPSPTTGLPPVKATPGSANNSGSSCAPSSSTLMGEAFVADPVTVCCTLPI